MAHDIVIRGGTIVDGTGAEPFVADLAIDEGGITAIGHVSASGRQELDAGGLTVTPGFVDLHTHFDAQIAWDPDLTPVSWHGVTTALMGNCGLSFAPCKASDRALLAGMMETVEDIPSHAILSGLPWTWDEDYGDYLAAIDACRPGINILGMVGHSAVRYYVMGDRSFAEPASPDEIRQMVRLVERALDAGAHGFSTNRLVLHTAPDGRPIPGTFAEAEELVAIARLLRSRGALMQAVGARHELLAEIADRTGVRILFIAGTGHETGAGKADAEALAKLCEGREMAAISQVRGTGFMFGLQSTLPFRGGAWDRLREMPLAERLAAILDEATAAALAAEGEQMFAYRLRNLFYLGDAETPDYTAAPQDCVEQALAASGETWPALFLRLSRQTDGRALFNLRMFHRNLDETADLIASPHVFPSLGDAGAHCTQVMDAGWATFVLSYWVRQRGLYSLAEGVRRITSGPAKVLGLADRGVLAVGMRADINVFDAETIAELQPRMVHDFPGGAARYTQQAKGYKATIVNGQVNVLDGRHTGVRAGGLLRWQAQARTRQPAG